MYLWMTIEVVFSIHLDVYPRPVVNVIKTFLEEI